MTNQFLRPNQDSYVDYWEDNNAGTTTIYAAIDEAGTNDADYVQSATLYGTYRCYLSDGSDPYTSSGHIVRFRIAREATNKDMELEVRLNQNFTTTKWSATINNPPGTFTEYVYTLNASQANSITDYTNLFFQFYVSVQFGTKNIRISRAELELPPAPFYQTCTAEVALYDEFDRVIRYDNAYSEAINVYDDLTLQPSHLYINEVVTLDDYVNVLIPYITLYDDVTINDTINFNFFQELSDSVTMTDWQFISRPPTYYTFTEYIHLMTSFRILPSSITFTESIVADDSISFIATEPVITEFDVYIQDSTGTYRRVPEIYDVDWEDPKMIFQQKPTFNFKIRNDTGKYGGD